MKNARFFILILMLVFVLFPELTNAQCAMCSATNESAMEEGSGYGINEGIIYLMGIPYLLLGILGFMFFRKRIGGFLKEMREIHP